MSENKNRISRRRFLNSGFKAGVSVTALGAFLSSCGVTGDRGGGEGASTITIPVPETPWLDSFRSTVDVYQEETGNTVNLQTFPFDGLLSNQLNAVDAQSDEFDIYCLNEQWCARFYNAEFVAPFEDIDSGFSLDSQILEYDSATRWDQDAGFFSENGTVLGLPIMGNIVVYCYRRDLYEELGLEPPETWEEAITAARQAEEEYDDLYGHLVHGAIPTFEFEPLLHGFGGSFFADPPNDWTVTIASEEAQQAIETWLELASYGPAQPHDVGQADIIALMQSGRALQTMLVTAAHQDMENEAESSIAGNTGYSLLPRPSEGTHSTVSGIFLMSIPAHIQDSQKEAAYDFLQWLMTQDAQMEYGRNGGVPTHQGVYESDIADQSEFRYMRAMEESEPHIQGTIRFPFAAEMLEVTDLRLNQILSGQLDPREALDRMADELATVVENAGVSS